MNEKRRDTRLEPAVDIGDTSLHGRSVDIRETGPLVAGERISLSQARRKFPPGKFPTPPTTPRTGRLSGIWTDALGQVAFVWDSTLTFYVDVAPQSEEQSLAEWAQKAADPTEPYWSLVDVRGRTALALNGDDGQRPSSLTFFEKGNLLQFVGGGFTVDELRSLAESITY